ncbi:unnamed protein product [Ambrosiozyma monospora]|uniref:Unnamed protein product n=1 Tax=Ambrosiozyma monospora TaxID=43982 RepID=A0A9W6YWY4_AMBMO|nr:unnamed protein product [Ambrosiozyma monospora]
MLTDISNRVHLVQKNPNSKNEKTTGGQKIGNARNGRAQEYQQAEYHQAKAKLQIFTDLSKAIRKNVSIYALGSSDSKPTR